MACTGSSRCFSWWFYLRGPEWQIEFQIGESPLNPYDLVWGTLKDGLWEYEFISQDSNCFLPNQIIVLCKDLEALDLHYELNPEALYWQTNSWLSLDDKSGECGLFLRNQDELERVCFDDCYDAVLVLLPFRSMVLKSGTADFSNSSISSFNDFAKN